MTLDISVLEVFTLPHPHCLFMIWILNGSTSFCGRANIFMAGAPNSSKRQKRSFASFAQVLEFCISIFILFAVHEFITLDIFQRHSFPQKTYLWNWKVNVLLSTIENVWNISHIQWFYFFVLKRKRNECFCKYFWILVFWDFWICPINAESWVFYLIRFSNICSANRKVG